MEVLDHWVGLKFYWWSLSQILETSTRFWKLSRRNQVSSIKTAARNDSSSGAVAGSWLWTEIGIDWSLQSPRGSERAFITYTYSSRAASLTTSVRRLLSNPKHSGVLHSDTRPHTFSLSEANSAAGWNFITKCLNERSNIDAYEGPACSADKTTSYNKGLQSEVAVCRQSGPIWNKDYKLLLSHV